ncbi:adenosine receptor A1-like [Solea solea]|uniref:adenosine receptor A1-like n=1 Tax=Solea solea TaxID=90069 RepID=UPI00272A7C6A|nr:adenosine receptor A1-like [Solea solea]
MENTLLSLHTFQQTRYSSNLSFTIVQPYYNSSSASPSSSSPPADLVISPNVAYMAAELVIAFLSTVGNLLVCIAVCINRNLRTVTNYFLVSLAVADICVGTVAIPCAILTGVGLPRHSFYLCLFMLSELILFTQSSIFSLLAVAVDRYVAIFMPFRYQALMTSRNAMLVILTTWLLAFFIGLVPLMGWHKTPPDSGYCLFVLVVDMTYVLYFIFFVCLLIPLLIMYIIYAHIFIMVKRQMRRIASEQSGRGGKQMRDAARIRREMKTATSLFLVLFLFTICWIPLNVMNCFLVLCPFCPVPFELLLTAIILSHANSAVNPFLYAYTMTAFRDTFKAIFLCCRPVRNREAANLDGGEAREGEAVQNAHQT